MKKTNAYYRKNKTMKGFQELTDEEANKIDKQIMEGYSWCQQPYPSYTLRNNLQNINHYKKRLESIKKIKSSENKEYENEYFKVVENTELVRLQLFFDNIPDKSIRNILKNNAFKWSPKNKCWQRQLTNNARYSLKFILKQLENENVTTLREQNSGNVTE